MPGFRKISEKLKYFCNQQLIKSLLLFSAMWVVGLTNSQGQKASFTLSHDSIQMGERFTATFLLDLTGSKIAKWPLLEEYLAENIEIHRVYHVDTTKTEDNRTILRQDITGTSFTPGLHQIPPFFFAIVENQDTLFVATEPVLLTVLGVAIQEDAVPYDIKPIFSMPVSFLEVLQYLLSALLIVLLLFGAWKIFIFQKKTKISKADRDAEIPPHFATLQHLEELKKRQLWQLGEVKLYYTELTYILRLYIEKRFAIKALEATSEEILEILAKYSDHAPLLPYLSNVFVTGDLVKFAKFVPAAHENELCMDQAIGFVKDTIPLEPPVEERSDNSKYQNENEEVNQTKSN